MPRQRWQIAPPQPAIAAHLGAELELSPLLAQVLINRGFDSPEAARLFLEPETQQLPSPLEEFPQLALSIELLVDAIATATPIAICGDYDADGMTSTALLLRALRTLGAQADYAIPSRMSEGYGINRRIVADFHREGVGLILTVDNGIAAYDPVAYAEELGLTVIITDHHDLPEQLPPASAILNPKLLPLTSPYRGVAGVGVAYVLAVCLAQALEQTRDLTAPLLELFTLGTIADLAPLTGVNRRWVRRGLGLLPRSRILGVQALIQVAGLGDQEKTLKPEDIGFRLGPRINAVGRISDPQIVIDLLTTDDVGVALERAMQCEQINQQRQELCSQIEQEAIAWCDEQQRQGQLNLIEDRVLLVVQPGWHHGVIGIVASRLVERYGVPVFIGTYEDDERKTIRGSARGIPEFNVFEALQACDDLLEKYGGHRAAGGFSFATKCLRQVQARLSHHARQQLQPQHIQPLVQVDVQAQLADIGFDLYEAIDRIQPCGIENSDPVFWSPHLRLLEQKAVGRQQDHLKLTVAQEGSSTLKAIAWRWGEYCPLPEYVDLAYRLRLNEWQGQRSVELEVVGVRPATAPTPPPASALPSPDRPSQPAARSMGAVLREPAAPSLPSQAPTWSSRAEFFYSRRQYAATATADGNTREVTLANPEGQQLVVQLPERRGFLCLPGEPPRPVDLSEAHYFNLLRAGLSALELHQQAQLLREKDALLVEKNNQITTLTRQIELLEAKLSQLDGEQKQQFQQLQQELQQQQSDIQSQEAHIAQLQAHLPATVAPQEIFQPRQAVGDNVWFCLSPASQENLQAAQRHQELAAGDYSAAGISLSAAIQRELLQPLAEALAGGSYGLACGAPEDLAALPPLLAPEWQILVDTGLAENESPPPDRLYGVAQTADSKLQAQMGEFLGQWDHPAAAWLRQDGAGAAAAIDQLAKLTHLAASPQPLLPWHYALMQELVLGSDRRWGLLRRIYGSPR